MNLPPMCTKVFDAALGLIKLSNINRLTSISPRFKDELTKAVLNRVYELTSNPSVNTQIDLSILLHQDVKIVNNWFCKLREQKRRKSKNDMELDFEEQPKKESTDIPATVIMQILCLVKDSLEGRSKMRRSKVHM